MWRALCTAAIVFVASACCLAQNNPRHKQINSAIDEAVAALQRQVEQMPLRDDLTVGALLEQTGGREQLVHALRRAQLVGGPRWIADNTCQVRLEISGPVVARVISALAAAHPKRSPISNNELQKVLAGWQDHEFAAEGTSAGPIATTAPRSSPPPAPPASQPVSLVPEQPPAWAGKQLQAMGEASAQQSTLQTIQAAQQAARRQLLKQVDTLDLTPSVTLGQASQMEADIAQAIQRGLDDAEMDRIHYDEKGGVRLRMTLNLWRLWRELSNLPQP